MYPASLFCVLLCSRSASALASIAAIFSGGISCRLMLNRLSFNQNRLLPLCAQLRAHALDHGVKLVVADIGKCALDHEFLRQRAANQAGKLNGVARAQYLDDRSPVLFPLTLKVSEDRKSTRLNSSHI